MYRLSEFSIQYNKSNRIWELHNGKLKASFDAADEGKRAAVLGAIRLADPDLYDLVQRTMARHSQLGNRPINAALLVHFHHVRESRDLTQWSVAEVLSQSYKPRKNQPRKLSVFQERGVLCCGCTDFERAAATVNGRTICKHLLAVSMAKRLGRLTWIDWEHKPLGIAGHRGGNVVMSDYVSPLPEIFKL